MILRRFDSFSAPTVKAGPAIWAIAFVAVSSSLYAEEPAALQNTSPSSTEEQAAANEASPFSGNFGLRLRSSTTNRTDYDYRIFINPSLSLNYEFKDLLTLGFYASGTKDLNNEQRSSLNDLNVSVSRSFQLLGADSLVVKPKTEVEPLKEAGLSLDLQAYYGAPVSRDLYKYSNSKGTLGFSPGLGYSFGGGLTGLNVNVGLTYERYLYQYEYANGGQILTKYSVSQSYGLSYTLGSWTLAGDFTNVSSWDFDDSKENDSFLAVETLRYKIDKLWSLQAGHINNGNTFDYLGESNNVTFYDKRRSQVFVGTSYNF